MKSRPGSWSPKSSPFLPTPEPRKLEKATNLARVSGSKALKLLPPIKFVISVVIFKFIVLMFLYHLLNDINQINFFTKIFQK